MKKYRVEAFIIPSNVKSESELNQIDDEKLDRLKNASPIYLQEFQIQNREFEKSNDEKEELYSSDISGLFFDINEHIYDEIVIPKDKDKKDCKKDVPNTEYTKALFKVEEPIYDEPFIGNLSTFASKNPNENYDVPQSRNWTLASSKYTRYGIVAPKLPKRTSSLKSIVEDNESIDGTLQELCCHGRKNGCLTSSGERPEDISEEIFKENWMQRLDSLKKLETLLKDKEIALQSRERLLFKKEKELRILERLVKDKMRQAELYAKRCRKNSSCESIGNNERNSESRSSDGSRDHVRSADGISKNTDSKLSLESKKLLPCPVNSRTSLCTDRLSSRVGSARSRSKPRQKIHYDDLDSTLSADIGDSSFAITSKKFDPLVFKKPAAFIRSASERRPNHRVDQQKSLLTLASLVEKDEHEFTIPAVVEEKAIRRISDNIIATQNQTTKFMNYGPIDKSFSHLNLETSLHSGSSRIKTMLKKERPVSWSENTDEWLMKKRQAYNLQKTKQSVEKICDKENSDWLAKINKSTKVNNAKRESNQKKFSIFR